LSLESKRKLIPKWEQSFQENRESF
jgi:hypothetical protein